MEWCHRFRKQSIGELHCQSMFMIEWYFEVIYHHCFIFCPRESKSIAGLAIVFLCTSGSTATSSPMTTLVMGSLVESLARRIYTQTLKWVSLTQKKTLICSTLSTSSTYYAGEAFHIWILHQAAWHAMRTKLGISPENIILYGQSIGTVPTVDLASRFEVGLQFTMNFGGKIAFGILRWGRWSFIVHWCPGCA